jgi:hypothetical protein
MTKRTEHRRYFFLETSAVIYQFHGHHLMRAAVREALGDGLPEVSNFIRMEYLRGVVVNLIELYFLIKDEDSVSDALIAWSQKVSQERKIKVVLMTISSWIVDQEQWQSREKSLRRLGDLIVRLVYGFDETFQGRMQDRLKCQLGRVTFQRRSFGEDMLLQFYEEFRAIQKSTPPCRLCLFKKKQTRSLARNQIDLHGLGPREKYKKYKGYVTQAERLENFVATIVTADRAFIAFCEILNREIRLLPSLAALKRQVHTP